MGTKEVLHVQIDFFQTVEYKQVQKIGFIERGFGILSYKGNCLTGEVNNVVFCFPTY